MSKAEEWALKHFPVEMVLALGPDDKPVDVDANRYTRYIAKKVYEMAEKDLALTGADIKLLHDIEAQGGFSGGAFVNTDEWYSNLAIAFNKSRK